MNLLKETFDGFAKSFSDEIYGSEEEVRKELFRSSDNDNDVLDIISNYIGFFEGRFDHDPDSILEEEFDDYFQALKYLKNNRVGQESDYKHIIDVYVEEKFGI